MYSLRFFALAILALAMLVQLTMATPAKLRYKRDTAAYSGAGGDAPGGSVRCPNGHCGSLINVMSNNAGKGGEAASGKAMDSRCKRSTDNSFSGAGGKSAGGDVDGASGGLVNIMSGNAGDGGDATSGDASPNAERC